MSNENEFPEFGDSEEDISDALKKPPAQNIDEENDSIPFQDNDTDEEILTTDIKDFNLKNDYNEDDD